MESDRNTFQVFMRLLGVGDWGEIGRPFRSDVANLVFGRNNVGDGRNRVTRTTGIPIEADSKTRDRIHSILEGWSGHVAEQPGQLVLGIF